MVFSIGCTMLFNPYANEEHFMKKPDESGVLTVIFFISWLIITILFLIIELI